MDKIVYYYIPLYWELIKAFAFTAILTAATETLFFYFLKYSKKHFLIFIFLINIFTNIILNIFISFAKIKTHTVLYEEIIVILVEYFLILLYLKPNLKNSLILLIQTTFANILSYSIGILWFSLTGTI